MKPWREFSVSVRRGEGPFYAFLYRVASRIRSLAIPTIRPLHHLLYCEWTLRTTLWHNFWRIVYYEPMFRSQCISVGPGFRMPYGGNGIARIEGDLSLYLGSGVTVFDNAHLAGLKVFDKPELHIGDRTYIGPHVSFGVGKKITVGRNCLITSRLITDNPGHSTKDTLRRLDRGGGIPSAEDVRPVCIGDFCFLALNTVVYPGVTVGDGVVARVGTHLNRDIPPFVVVGGNPARIVRKLPIPPQMAEIVGRDRYESYVKAHKQIELPSP